MTTATRATRIAAGDGPWLTLQEAAVYISASVKTVRRRIAAGELPAYVCGSRGLRVRREDLDGMMRPL